MNENEFDKQDSAAGQDPQEPVSDPASEDTPKEAPQTASANAPEAVPSDHHQAAFSDASEVQPENPPACTDSQGNALQAMTEDATPRQKNTVYRWTYAEQKAHDEAAVRAADTDAGQGKKKKHTGLWVYALVMTGVFAVSFGILLGVLFMTAGDNAWTDNILTSDGYADHDPVTREDMSPVEASKQSVVVIEVITEDGSGTGTGVVMTSDGYIATNHHVIEGATKIRVSFLNGESAYATVIGSSAMDDLAVIKVDQNGLIPATFADSNDCYVGQTVFAIGTPAGSDFSWTTTRGIISYVNREVRQYDETGTMTKKLRLIQTDAKVNPGNSGGPLVNADGQVVGIVSMKLAGGYEGIGFAIPSDGALEILEAIMKDGNADSVNSTLSFKRPLLGIVGVYVEAEHDYIMDDKAGRIYDVTNQDASAVREQVLAEGGIPSEVLTPKATGILVTSVTDGMGASGVLRKNDIITAVEGQEVGSMNSLVNVINDHYAGDTVTVDVYRDGKTLILSITLSAMPD